VHYWTFMMRPFLVGPRKTKNEKCYWALIGSKVFVFRFRKVTVHAVHGNTKTKNLGFVRNRRFCRKADGSLAARLTRSASEDKQGRRPRHRREQRHVQNQTAPHSAQRPRGRPGTELRDHTCCRQTLSATGLYRKRKAGNGARKD